MDTTILKKLIDKKEITDKDLEDALYEMCEDLHASECHLCLMIEKGLVTDDDGCKFHKNGRKMLAALRKESK